MRETKYTYDAMMPPPRKHSERRPRHLLQDQCLQEGFSGSLTLKRGCSKDEDVCWQRRHGELTRLDCLERTCVLLTAGMIVRQWQCQWQSGVAYGIRLEPELKGAKWCHGGATA
ncbi:hypothetical protein M3J09_009305 [Ascochyta lentis]